MARKSIEIGWEFIVLTERQIELIKTSFRKIAPDAPKAASLFYNRLFEIAPDTKTLFKETDMVVLGNKLMQMVGTAVASLHHTENIVTTMKQLGIRHHRYQVTSEQYQPVGEALLWALQQSVGDDWDDELHEAWKAMYSLMSQNAIAGAEELA